MIPLRDSVVGEKTPYVAYGILALNVLVFLWELTRPAGHGIIVSVEGQRMLIQDGFQQAVWTFGLRPAEVLGGASLAPATPIPEWATVFTSMFMHGGWMHIIGNMLYLWIFADNVEDAMGHGRFVVFYLLAGVAAAGAQMLVNPSSAVPMVGASGALAGVMGGYLILYPQARVTTLVPIFYFIRIMEIPAVFFLGFWIFLQVISAPAGGGTAWFAHIGGFLFGVVAVRFFATHKARQRRPAHGRTVEWDQYFRR